MAAPVAATSRWSSRFAFVLVSIGAAVGLGNVWKFPYTAGTGGGGAFVLVYLLGIAAIAIPAFMAETLIGREGRLSAPRSLAHTAQKAGASSHWRWAGWLGVATITLILSFYCVFASWTIAFIPKAAAGQFAGLDGASARALYEAFRSDPATLILWHALFMGLVIGVVSRGVTAGLERANRILMPALLVLLLILVAYALAAGDAAAGLRFLFHVDFDALTPAVALSALGQAAFTMNIGVGGVLTYGVYLERSVSIPRATLTVAAADTTVALLAGLAVFPLVFAYGLDPAQGAGLVFATLPIAFGDLTGGAVFGALFFLFLAFAALTSAISMMEVSVRTAVETRRVSRLTASLGLGAVIWLLGFATLFSFNAWSDIRPLAFLSGFEDATIFNALDHITLNIALPMGGALFSLFAGWVLTREPTAAQLGLGTGALFQAWRWAVRIVVPGIILAVFVANFV
ncbi:MAG: sodium-dependent transporter [Sphingomonadales bacterium]|nr:sodium-dependent transporter [Sphingomonadales bacterium]